MANYASVDIFGDPRSPGWEEQNLRTIRASNGQSWRVHQQAAPSFEGLLGDLIAAGYDPRSSGGFNYRTVRGGTRLSQHAFGNAIDINAATNPMLRGKLVTDMPANVGELAAKHGLVWGGSWKNRPDPMHFEWTGAGGTIRPPTGTSSAALSSTPIAQQMMPDTGPAPAVFGDVVAPTPVQTTTVAPTSFGDLAQNFLVNQQATQQAKRAEEAAEAERKAALFGSSLFGMYA